jgi:phospholipid/cholesterol/gamma-HCH transport system permease protein
MRWFPLKKGTARPNMREGRRFRKSESPLKERARNSMLTLLENLGRYCHFAARCLTTAPGAVRRPRELARVLFDVLIGALPLATVTGLALGVVIWLHLHRVLERFGAAAALPQALALAVVLEFAPTGAGLIVAGRSGASLGAELSSMRLTEQIDALEALGLSARSVLIAPRVLACVLALPVLSGFIVYFALGGGYAAEAVGGNLSWMQYQAESLRGLRVEDVVPAVLKTMVFGYLIGTTSCYFGINASGGTEGVGRAATRSVVVSTFLVLICNVVLVRLIQVMV